MHCSGLLENRRGRGRGRGRISARTSVLLAAATAAPPNAATAVAGSVAVGRSQFSIGGGQTLRRGGRGGRVRRDRHA